MLKEILVSVSPQDLVDIHKDRTGDVLEPEEAQELLAAMQEKLTSAMTWAGYGVIIDYLTEYQRKQEEA